MIYLPEYVMNDDYDHYGTARRLPRVIVADAEKELLNDEAGRIYGINVLRIKPDVEPVYVAYVHGSYYLDGKFEIYVTVYNATMNEAADLSCATVDLWRINGLAGTFTDPNKMCKAYKNYLETKS